MTAIEQLVGGDVWRTVNELKALEDALRAVRLELERSQGMDPSVSLVTVVVDVVAEEFGVEAVAVRGRGRTMQVALARQVAMSLTHQLFIPSISKVGRMFGRDHGTVCWAIRAVADAVSTDPKTARRVAAIRQRLTARESQPVQPLAVTLTPMKLAA